MQFIWVWIIPRSFGTLAAWFDGIEGSRPVEQENDGDLLSLLREMIERRGNDRVRITKVKGHADERMVQVGRGENLTGWEITRLMRLLILGVGGWIQGLLMHGATFWRLSAFVSCCSGVAWFFIAISRAVANHDDSLTLLSGLLVPFPQGVGSMHAVGTYALLPGPGVI